MANVEYIKNETRAVILHINMELRATNPKTAPSRWKRLTMARSHAEGTLKQLGYIR